MRPLPRLRSLVLLALTALALPAAAQNRPPNLQPVPEPPPPPRALDDALEPQVTIIRRGEDQVEEYRMNNKLYMLKVTPPHGTPYYLIDQRGDGSFIRHNIQDSGLRVPMWVIGTF